MRANIPFIATGQTFKSWMQVTNEIVDQINQASDVGFSNGLVRYDSTGALNISNFSSPSITINGRTITNVSDDFTVPSLNTIASTVGILNLVDSRANVVYDTNTIIRTEPTLLTGRVNNISLFTATEDQLVVHSNTIFDQNLHVTGNFTVNGSSVSIETTQLAVEDRVITLNKNAPGGIVDGSGFEIDGTTLATSFTYDHVNKGFNLTANGVELKIVAPSNIRVDFDQNLSKASSVKFNQIQANARLTIPVVTAIPASGVDGEIIFDTANNEFIGYDGNRWHNLGEGAVASSVATTSGNTYVEANNVTESIEFVANTVNIMDLTANSFTIFNHTFESVSGNLYSNAVSTDLVTGITVKSYVDKEVGDNVNTLNAIITTLSANVANVVNTVNNKIASINSATITIGTMNVIPYGNNPTVINSGDNVDAILDFEFPEGPTGVSLSGVTKKSNNEIQFNFTDSSNTTIDFNFGRLDPLTPSQKTTVFGQDYELRALTDNGGVFSGDLTIWDPNSGSGNWVDLPIGSGGSPSANTTKFYGVESNLTNNEIVYIVGGSGDELNTEDYDVWSLGTAIKFEVQDNNLVLETT